MNPITEELKKHFDLNKSPRPIHEFSFGKVFGQWQMATDYWSQLVGTGMGAYRQDIWFGVYRIKSIDGYYGHVLTIWRLKVIFGFVK